MTKSIFLAAFLAAAGAAHAQAPLPGAAPAVPAPAAGAAPIVVAGTVADEAGKAALLARLRAVYGHERVVDQLAVGTVATPANWNEYVGRLIGPNLKMISRGQLKVTATRSACAATCPTKASGSRSPATSRPA